MLVFVSRSDCANVGVGVPPAGGVVDTREEEMRPAYILNVQMYNGFVTGFPPPLKYRKSPAVPQYMREINSTFEGRVIMIHAAYYFLFGHFLPRPRALTIYASGQPQTRLVASGIVWVVLRVARLARAVHREVGSRRRHCATRMTVNTTTCPRIFGVWR